MPSYIPGSGIISIPGGSSGIWVGPIGLGVIRLGIIWLGVVWRIIWCVNVIIVEEIHQSSLVAVMRIVIAEWIGIVAVDGCAEVVSGCAQVPLWVFLLS